MRENQPDNPQPIAPLPLIITPSLSRLSRPTTQCVPIAPLPSYPQQQQQQHPHYSATTPCTTAMIDNHSLLDIPLCFPANELLPDDVLLKKGGRPTHGKKRYFAQCQQKAYEYANYKSPLDRRLLARKLVEDWIAQGGRFCTAVDIPTGNNNNNSSSIKKVYFRVASTEEALLFTRRVLVRHFTPSVSGKPNKNKDIETSSQRAKKKNRSTKAKGDKVSKIRTDDQKDAGPSLTQATSDAADALCFLRAAKTNKDTTTNESDDRGPISTPMATSLTRNHRPVVRTVRVRLWTPLTPSPTPSTNTLNTDDDNI